MTGPDVVLRPGVGGAARISTDLGHHLRMVPVLQHSLVLVEEGVKEVHGDSGVVQAKAGEVVALTAGTALTLFNRLDPDTGRYRATVLMFDQDCVASFHDKRGVPEGRGGASPSWMLLKEVPAVLHAVRHAIQAVPAAEVSDAIAHHRFEEVLLALAEQGVTWQVPVDKAVSQRIRLMIAGRPDAPWNAADVAQELAMSGATLRRRLAAEQTCFRDLLAEVRLSYGLTLLQTSRAGIAEIAMACGYDSPSRFATRFRERFGTPPSGIRTSAPAVSESG